ncbi:glutamine--tRNA ligase/YqeY domain fusion protein [Chromobacterium piscinae]|uniref:Glutamine--tRNA ligase n=1 Tax=Chromobacterium piscinae TaxID=686831 RepID=A0ABV0H6K5_9NEIS|nr:glutamine--tRNA ligase/YqeY domain fusion protein [Chromobacterium piscinae]MBX9298651.1 glutamine--tRNA ligase/YqeY domain fusion protein [Chromobacterium vaccinii]MBX9347366.1 glutamine--tRNA ligase/YqeY domain fusion protein [Chromobacterium vaccinii]MBX9357556.1 glutamine--tRNA ligase/YqeY domain fusion protein [Chromobacterium vaccinii]MCD5328043.1 glutamine--tRNA ligase/YqeY domain fusion protein [Chromobacterium piscinae]NHQ80660.1 glutamine--tRNA ligase/YqeY domain fusion protein [C
MSTENNAPVVNNFIRSIIDEDLATGRRKSVVTRFPPEPNGFAHIGHAKAICINFGLAEDYNGQCNLRMDDTNPEKESDEFVEAFKQDISWLGFKWNGEVRYASDYFDRLYGYAVELIQAGKAYVDDLSAEEMRQYRGNLTEPGKNSPYRDRTPEENLDLFTRMKNGEFPDGSKTLRLKIDMASGNINLRDPAIYRIRRVHHHRTGDKWCIYPMYDYTHCISDAIEGITHSLCSLEFEDHRPLYDWVLDNISIGHHPQQIEFSRLELLYALTSKRKLQALVNDGAVTGWDDPRMPTIAGMRRRGYSPAGIKLFAQRIGVSKSENIIDMAILEGAVRETLENDSPRVMAVVNPLKVTLSNYDAAVTASRSAPFHPHHPEFGEREVPIAREIWIERDDFAEVPPPKWQRLTAGGEVRLRYSYVIKCDEVVKDANGEIIELKCSIDHDTLGKNPEGRKVKGVIHWVSAEHAIQADVRWYERLFTEQRPDAVRGEDGEYVDFRQFLSQESLKLVPAFVEASVLQAEPESRFQFERLGYFVTDRYEHRKGDKAVFNRTVGLKDSWK